MKEFFATALILGAVVAAGKAQSAAGGPAFEVASVRPLKDPTYGAFIGISGNNVTVSGPVKHLIELAYGLKPYQVTGGPVWVDSGDVLFVIRAKTPEGSSVARPVVRQMLRALLKDRFGLRVHEEKRSVAVYNLVVGRSGLKMKPNNQPGATSDLSMDMGPLSRISGVTSVAGLVVQLQQLMNERPIIDKTGLAGLYDVSLEWAQPDAAPADTGAASLFTAIQEALGLRLEAAREESMVLVIDEVRRPEEN